MEVCASCGHRVPVNNMLLHQLNCRGPGKKATKKRPRAESGGAGSAAKPATTQRPPNVAGKNREATKTSAAEQGKGRNQQSKEEASPDEKKEERRRRAEERRKADIDSLRNKILESRCEEKHASRYDETRRDYGFASKAGATPDPVVPPVIKIGLAGFDCVRHRPGQDQHDLQTRLWKAEMYLAAFPRLLEWQCPEPGEEDEDEEWDLMRQVLKRARARPAMAHKEARVDGKGRRARRDAYAYGSDQEDDDDEAEGEGATDERLQLVLVVPQKFTPRGFAFDVEKEGDFDDFLSKVDSLRYDRIILLFQLPFSFVFRADRRNVMRDQRISRVRAWELKVCAHGKYRVAFEFLHYSWDHDDFRTSVLRCGITMVSHDAFDYEMLRREAGNKANRKRDDEEDEEEEEEEEEADEVVPPQPSLESIIMPMPYRFYPNKMTSRALLFFRLHGVEGAGDYGPTYMEQLARKILKSYDKFPEREVLVVFANTRSTGPAQPGEVDRGKARSAVVDAQHLGVTLKKLCMEKEGGEESGEGEEETGEGEGEGEGEEEEEEEEEREGREERSDASDGVERAAAERPRPIRFMDDDSDSEDDRFGFLSPSRGANGSGKSIQQEEGGQNPAGAGVIALVGGESDSDATVDEAPAAVRTGSGASGSAAASSSSATDMTRNVKVEEPSAVQPRPSTGDVINLCDSDSD